MGRWGGMVWVWVLVVGRWIEGMEWEVEVWRDFWSESMEIDTTLGWFRSFSSALQRQILR